tara:strand:- start:942 stop:1286 length:345 start_codon:yes stop_codon:yes gene_type:complete
MEGKKVFYLDTRGGSRITGELISELNSQGETRFANKRITSIPRDYDLYIIHISDIPNMSLERDLDKLKEEQEWSRFVGIGGAATGNGPTGSFAYSFDTTYLLLTENLISINLRK